MKIVNKKASYAFQNRIISFNEIYREKLPEGVELTEDLFSDIGDAWLQIAEKYTDADRSPNVDNIKETDWLSEEDYNILLNATKQTYQKLRRFVVENDLGETHTNEYGTKITDHTYVSGEILELGVLAVETYTNFFEQCSRYRDYTAGLARSSEIAHSMFSDNPMFDQGLSCLGVEYPTRSLLTNPFVAINPALAMYNEQTYKIVNKEERTPYYLLKAIREQEQRVKEEEDKKIREEQARRKEEEDRIRFERELEEERIKLAQEQAQTYDAVKAGIKYVPNKENPGKINTSFYSYFDKVAERLGIDQSVLNAQTLIDAMGQIQLETEKNDDIEFSKKIVPLYRQLRRVAFESYVNKCLSENKPIDLNVAASEVDYMMGALVYTADPIGINQSNSQTQIRARIVLSGNLLANERKISLIDRGDVLKYTKEAYRAKGDEFFMADGMQRYESFASEKQSSSTIVRNAETVLSEYERYKERLSKNEVGATRQGQADLKKAAFDAAFALERRLETRYKSKIARFFRYFSYRNQRNELARMKTVLEVKPEERIADKLIDSRLNDLFVDVSDPAKYNMQEVALANTTAVVQIMGKLTREIGPLPKVQQSDLSEEKMNRIKRSEEIKEEKELEEELEYKKNDPDFNMEEERKRIEEEKRLHEEEVRKEEERQQAEIEKKQKRELRGHNLQKQIENLRNQEETDFREKVYEEQLSQYESELKTYLGLKATMDKNRENSIKYEQNSIDELETRIKSLEEENETLKNSIESLGEQMRYMVNFISEKTSGLVDSKEIQSDLKKASKQAKKDSKKAINKQKLQSGQKVADFIAEDYEVQAMKTELAKIEKLNVEYSDKFNSNKEAITSYKMEQDSCRRRIETVKSYHEDERQNDNLIRKCNEKIDYLKKNKEDIISSGQGLDLEDKDMYDYIDQSEDLKLAIEEYEKFKNEETFEENENDREPLEIDELSERVVVNSAQRISNSKTNTLNKQK